MLTVREIEEAEGLWHQGELARALELYQSMLPRAQDDDTRFRLLFDILYCSTRLGEEQVTAIAIDALEQMPYREQSGMHANLIQAIAHIALGRSQDAVDLLDANLKLEFMNEDGFLQWRYAHLFYKGRALAFLHRWMESLSTFERALHIRPGGDWQAEILLDQALCLKELRRFDEAIEKASQVVQRNCDDLHMRAKQYIAECYLTLGEVQEALRLYMEIKDNLPCGLIQEDRLEAGIEKCVLHLELHNKQNRPN